MGSIDETAVPWEFLGLFLTNAQEEINAALKDMPESRLSYLEIKLYRKVEDDSPLEEYNLSVGEEGKQLCSDIEEEGSVPEPQLTEEGEAANEMPLTTQPFIEGAIPEMKIADIPQEVYKPTPAYELVRSMVYDIRDGLAGSPEVKDFAVGIRAMVSTNPDECTGFCCARRRVSLIPLRYAWFLQEYYINALGLCRKRWTSSRC